MLQFLSVLIRNRRIHQGMWVLSGPALLAGRAIKMQQDLGCGHHSAQRSSDSVYVLQLHTSCTHHIPYSSLILARLLLAASKGHHPVAQTGRIYFITLGVLQQAARDPGLAAVQCPSRASDLAIARLS